MRRRLLATILATLVASLVLASSAIAAQPNLTAPTPWKCGGGVTNGTASGCYGNHAADNSMDDSSVGNMFVSPHVLHVGQTLTATMQHQGGQTVFWPTSQGGLQMVGSCAVDAATCQYQATAPSSGWDFFKITFSAGVSSVEEDYYVVLNDGYAIQGKVTDTDPHTGKQVPAVGVKVNAYDASNHALYSWNTGPNGEYVILVPRAAEYAVATAAKHCVAAQLPQCVTRKYVTVGPDAQVDFQQPPKVRISGTVADENGNGAQDVTISARDASGNVVGHDKTTPAGHYEMVVPVGQVHIQADDSAACIPSPGGACPKTKDIDLQGDQTIDWKLQGCVSKVDFENSMVAVNGCFTKQTGEVWTTDKPFRLNGIDVNPQGVEATLDKTAQTVTFGKVSLKLGAFTVAVLPGLTLNFAAPTQTFNTNQLSIYGIKIPDEAVSLTSEAGKSTFTFAVKLAQAFGFSNTGCNGTVDGKLTAVTTNDKGLSQLGVSVEDSPEPFCVPTSSGPGIKITGLSGLYDLNTHWWTLSAKMKGVFGLGKASLTIGVILDNNFYPRNMSVNVGPGLNKPLDPPLLFLQSAAISVGNDTPTGPFKIQFGAGFSAFPQLSSKPLKANTPFGSVIVQPTFVAYLDTTLGFSAKSLSDLGLSGTEVLSFWDYKLLTGTFDYISKSNSIVLGGKIGFNTPDGRVGFNGTGKGFLDSARNILQVEGRVNATIPELGRGAADLLALSADGHNTLAACFLAQAGAVGARYGFVWDLANWLPSADSACDIGKFRKAPPAGVGVAGTNRSFTVRPKTPVVVVEVSGPPNGTAPAFKLTGPRANAVRLPVPAKNLTYLVLRAPRPGRYTIAPTAGSVISGLRFAGVLPEPKVTGSVSGTVCAPVARWSIKPLPGQSVTIADIGTAGDTRALVQNAPRTGSLTLPLDAQPGLRSLEALVYEGRTLRRTIPLDTYNAPGELSAPLGVRVRRNGKRLVVAWKAVCGATRYRVIVSGRRAATVRKTSYTVTGKLRGRTPTVTVAPVGPDGTVGDLTTRSLAPGAL